MGKANKAKHNKQRFNNVTYKWEELLEEKDKLVHFYSESIAKLNSLINLHKVKIEKNLTLKNKVNGLMYSFLDLSKKIRFTMERHIEYEYMISKVNTLEYFIDPANAAEYDTLIRENSGFNKKVKHRQGKVNSNNQDDLYTYIGIQSAYVGIGMELAHLLQTPLINILSDLGAMDEDLKEFDKIEEEAMSGLTDYYKDELKEAESKIKQEENNDGKQE